MNSFRIIYIFVLLFISVSCSYGASVTPQRLAQSFNLRTVYSSYAQTLKMYCLDYPTDYFEKKNIKVTSNAVIFENNTRYLKLKILGEYLIEMTDVIKGRSYSTKSEYTVFYDDMNKDIRAKETYIDYEVEPCVPFTEKVRRYMEDD